MQNKSYYAVQGHLRSSMVVPTESPYATSYDLTDIPSRTVSKFLQKFWTKNGDFAF